VSGDEGWTTNADDLRLYWRRLASEGEPKAALLFVHGLAEHTGRYRHVMEHFAARGYECFAVDMRGHGKSPGRRVHVNRFDEYLTDVRAGHDLAREANPERQLFLIGHSQGGLITLRYALAHPQDLAGIVISSPFLGLHPDARPSPALGLAAHILSTLTPRLLLSKPPDPSFLSHDPEVGKAYLADPLVSRKVSARWFTEVMAAHADTLARAGDLRVPALVMQSGDDRLADPAATRAWAAAAPAHLVEYVEWEGFYHEMFNEPEKEQVFAKVESWLSQF
jgi:alpha-beta hydrolase superfamily lysophospholipase